MAYVANGTDDNEEQQNNQVSPTGGGGGVHLAPSAGVGSVGTGAGTSGNGQQAGGGSFATINQYLNANQGQAQPLANQITSGITNQYNSLNQQNQNVAQGIQGQVDQGYTKENQGLLSQEAANPVDFAGNNQNVQGFQGQLNDQYNGPATAEGTSAFTGQQANINNAISQGQASTQTEAGREGLLQSTEKAPTQGVTALNSAILSQDPNATSSIENAYQPFQNLVSGLNSSGQQIDQNIAGAQKEAAKASTDANNQLQGQVTGLNSTVGGEQSALSNQFNGYNTQAAADKTAAGTANSDIQNYLSNTPQIGKVDTSALNPYLNVQQLTGAAPTDANSATSQDYATQNALQTLAGANNPLNTVITQNTAGQAGTALPTNFAQLQSSLNGMPAAENGVLGNIAGGISKINTPLQAQIKQANQNEALAKAIPAYNSTLSEDNEAIKAAQTNPGALKGDSKAVKTLQAAKAKLAADQAAFAKQYPGVDPKTALNGATQFDTNVGNEVNADQWLPGAATNYNSLLNTLGSSQAPISPVRLPDPKDLIENTTPSGGLFGGNLLNTLSKAAAPITMGTSLLAPKLLKR